MLTVFQSFALQFSVWVKIAFKFGLKLYFSFRPVTCGLFMLQLEGRIPMPGPTPDHLQQPILWHQSLLCHYNILHRSSCRGQYLPLCSEDANDLLPVRVPQHFGFFGPNALWNCTEMC